MYSSWRSPTTLIKALAYNFDYGADYWEFLTDPTKCIFILSPDFREILESPLATDLTTCNMYWAEFWDFVSDPGRWRAAVGQIRLLVAILKSQLTPRIIT